MSTTTATCLFQSKLVPTAVMQMYQSPAKTTTIIDKLTITNQDTSARTVTIYIVPTGGSVGPASMVTSAYSLAAGATEDVPDVKNHVLAPGDAIFMQASVANVVSSRGSGRQIV